MRIAVPAALLALFGAAASAQEIQAPPPGTEFLMKCSAPPYELTLFKDGRAIVKGTGDPAVARALYARYVGS